MLLDPKTYAYLGQRLVTSKDETIRSDGEPPRVVKKGTLVGITVRLAAGIVDKPGERP
ncbi:hypothetical protein [Actinomadura sp. 6N118]|uniref:hypothetical protein n=1 Tax=Actinomadura sp. 6N118 TaxID=3375151 RepID=UPI0037A00FC5